LGLSANRTQLNVTGHSLAHADRRADADIWLLINDAASVRPGWQSLMTIGMYTVNEGRLCPERRAIHARFTPNRGRTFKRFTTELVTYYERRTVGRHTKTMA